jgi:hypothetical protein
MTSRFVAAYRQYNLPLSFVHTPPPATKSKHTPTQVCSQVLRCSQLPLQVPDVVRATNAALAVLTKGFGWNLLFRSTCITNQQASGDREGREANGIFVFSKGQTDIPHNSGV